MELNAVAGRGEDPGIALRSTLEGSRSTPSSPQLPRAFREHDGLSGGTTYQYDGGSSSHTIAPQRRHPGSTGIPTPEKSASWGRSQGFVPAGLAPAGGGGEVVGEATAACSWETTAEGMGRQRPWGERPSAACHQEHAQMAGSNGFGTRGLEYTAGAPASACIGRWQPGWKSMGGVCI